LVLPDLKAINNAKKNHLAEHKQTSSSERIPELDSLEQFLIEHILIVASK
jgi:hypothetical protein